MITRRVALGAWLGLGALAILAFALLPAGSDFHAISPLAMVTGQAALAIFALLRWRGSGRAAWMCLTVGTAVYAVASWMWYGAPLVGVTIPFPSVIDPLYFAAYAGWATFLFVLHRSAARHDADLWLDTTILTVGFGCLVWGYLDTPVDSVAELTLADGVSLGYVGALLVLFMLAVRTTLVPSANRVARALLLTWIGLELIADAAYSHAATSGSFTYWQWYTYAWMGSAVTLGALALVADLPKLAEPIRVPARAWSQRRLAALVAASLAPLVAVLVVPTLSRTAIVGYVVVAIVLGALTAVRVSRLAVDFHAERRVTARLADQASHDPLTGVGNRVQAFARLAEWSAADATPDPAHALLIADLDEFKAVNDMVGHSAGDAVLEEVARRLRVIVRPRDVVARLGGDEFVLLLDDVDRERATTVAERVLSALREPVDCGDGVESSCRASIGVYMVRPGEPVARAMQRGDVAMYAAKARGGDQFEVWTPALDEQYMARLVLANELRGAVDRAELLLEYQPVIELASGATVGAEALVRWRRPGHGLLAPGAFIAVAEESATIADIGRFVLRTACEFAVACNGDRSGFEVSVNVSAPNCGRPTSSPTSPRSSRRVGSRRAD